MSNEHNSLVRYIYELRLQGATEEEIKKRYNSFIENKARENKIPLNGKFELTPLCNLDCKMCYVHLGSDQFKKTELISCSVWKNLIDEAHNAGMIYSTLTGGECLTYPHFDEIYLYLYSKGIVPTVMTNGLLLDRDRIDFFRQYPPFFIQITLYGSSNDAYERVTGRRVFSTIYHNLELLRESGLRAHITLTPSVFMREDIRLLQETAKSVGLPYSINASLITPRENTGRQLEDLGNDQYMEIYKVWKEMREEELAPIDPAELPMERKEGNRVYGLTCGGGTSSFTIQYNGKMAPCPSLADVTTEPLSEGFLNAWHQLNDLVGKYPMPAECPDCAYYGYCLQCPAIHNVAGNPGHCDTRICERTKRLIQEGFIPFQAKTEKRNK